MFLELPEFKVWLHLIHCICNRPCATIILILSSEVLVGRLECNFLISQSWFLSRAVNKGWEPGLFLGYFELTTSYFHRIQIESNDLPCSIPSWLVACILQLEILLAALLKKSWPMYAIDKYMYMYILYLVTAEHTISRSF